MERTLEGRTHGKRRISDSYYLKAFIYGLAVSFIFFIPFIVFDNGYFLFYGDFNVQQVPFYQMCHDAIRSGNIFWSWTTDLGANFIGSYSFYLLGSPFFWLTLPFPSDAVPYLMGPLLILKFGCASLTGFIYLKRYAKNRKTALIGGMLYAFSGFSIYNIFFNHFHEAIVIFPLLLFALDEFMYTRRRGVFALMVFASCFMNYYFFVGQAVFCFVYWAVRCITRSWRMSVKDFLWLLFESVLRLAMSALLLIPSCLAVLRAPRVDNPTQGWNALLYNIPQRYLHILECFFFPPDIPARPNFTPDSESKWASLGAWLPLFSMTGVIAFLQRRKKHWLKVLLGVLFLMAMVPFLNSAFQAFNANYYARWFYTLTLMMSLSTVLSLDLDQINWKRALIWTTAITLGICLPIGLFPKTVNSGGETTTTIGLEAYPTRFWAYVAISLLSLLLLGLILVLRKRRPQVFHRAALCSVALVSVVYSAYFIALGKTQSDDTHKKIIPYALNGGEDITLTDLQDVRSDFYKSMDNQAMYWQIPSIQAFHSIVPGSIMEFYPTIGVTRDVGSRPDIQYYGLRGLTSCKYLFDDIQDSNYFSDLDSEPQMPGWKLIDTQNGFDIWENQYYIPMGFSYDYYVTRSEYNNALQENRHLLLLKAIVIEDSEVHKYQDILSPLLESNPYPEYSEQAYLEDCLDRQAMSCSFFARDNRGFSATFTSDQDRLVFFSVPYESGWSATVNGQPAEIEKVNVGFMAVRVPAGTSTIRFDYYTPGLTAGICVTAGSFALFFGYVWGMNAWEKRRARALGLTRLPVHNGILDDYTGLPLSAVKRGPRRVAGSHRPGARMRIKKGKTKPK